MSLVKIQDAAGKTMTLIEANGYRIPNVNIEAAKNLPNFSLRQEDVLIVAYPKSGTHWVWEMCRMLLAGRTNLDVIAKESQMIELTDHKLIDAQPSPRILNTHVRLADLPTDYKKFNNKIIYIDRNPKDLAVSYYNHTRNFTKFYEYDGDWKDYLQLFLEGSVDYGSWFDYAMYWEDVIQNNTDLQILHLTYENIKENPTQELERISEFLEVTANESLLTEIIGQCSFKKMKNRKGNFSSIDGRDSVIYRKGQVGDWKNWFTVAQNEAFDKVYTEKMKRSKLCYKFQI